MDRDLIVLDSALAKTLMAQFFEGDPAHYPNPDFYTIKLLEHCVLLEARMKDVGTIYSTNIDKDLDDPIDSAYKIEDWRVIEEITDTTRAIKKIALVGIIFLSLLTCVVLDLLRGG